MNALVLLRSLFFGDPVREGFEAAKLRHFHLRMMRQFYEHEYRRARKNHWPRRHIEARQRIINRELLEIERVQRPGY